MNNCSALQITDNRQQAECAVGVPADMDFINADLSDMGRRNTGIFPFKRPLLYFLDQLLSQMVFHCDGTNAHPMAFLDDSPFQFSGNSDVGRRQKMQMFKVATMAGLTIQSMNPDSEVDQMLLNFPILSDYILIVDNEKTLFLTHGHIYNEEKFPKGRFDAFFYGHTHLWKLEKTDKGLICNTGSITFPKQGNVPTFAVYENGTVRIYQLNGTLLKEITI